MARHARRRDHRRTRRWALPLAVAGLGLTQLGVATTGVGLAGAIAAPSVDDRGQDGSEAGESSTPCAERIQACVKLSTQEVWITDGAGKILRGPIRMNHGDDENPTPTGTFHVQRKDQYHVSQEQQGRKMPYAVFFDGEGRAFHEGDPGRQSVGCVRMAREDARLVFENLDIGDAVQIVK